MRRSIIALTTATLGMGLLAACHSDNDYTPSATSTNLAAYAATAKFPTSAEPKENAKLTATVAPNAELTVRNFSSGVISNFNLWINQTYVLHVDHLDAGSFKTFDPSLFYNSAGNSLAGTTPDMIKKVQISTPNGELMNVQGPQMSQ